MGPGFKYHVVTIAAIFFALTTGLVIGSLYVSPRVADRQTREINRLTGLFNSDINDKSLHLNHYKEILAAIMPLALQGRLAGVHVALMQTGEYPDAITSARDALEMAGAQVVSVTTIEPVFDRPDEQLVPTLAALHDADSKCPTDRAGLAQSIARLVAHGDSATDPLLPTLERDNLMHADPGDSVPGPAQYIVLVAGSRVEGTERPTRVDEPLVEALQKEGATVVACEPENALVSDIGAYRTLHMDIATVDNVDTDIGQCALVFALNGDKDDYGVKPTANHLLPPIPTKSTPP